MRVAKHSLKPEVGAAVGAIVGVEVVGAVDGADVGDSDQYERYALYAALTSDCSIVREYTLRKVTSPEKLSAPILHSLRIVAFGITPAVGATPFSTPLM